MKHLRQIPCEVREDNLTRQLYATDASIYQIQPKAVGYPRTPEEASEALQAAAADDVPVTPRGAGTGLAGGALGDGLILDCARYNTETFDLNVEQRTVRVGAGVVLDQLNAYLRPHDLCFGPDVATSSRATLGGMIANNSSGARVPRYGTTLEHVKGLELVMPDGRIAQIGGADGGLPEESAAVAKVMQKIAPVVQERFHKDIIKRWPGYGLDRYLRDNNALTHMLGGSEGTLAVIWSATLDLNPLPQEKGLGLIFFNSTVEAMQATVDLLDLNAVAIEHVDDVLLDQTRGQKDFQRARDILRLDEHPIKSILLVEFYEDVDDKLAELERRNLGTRTYTTRDELEMLPVWNLRKAGLALLVGRKGDAKPVAGIEDVAVRPKDLPYYVRGLQELMKPLGLIASFYGHAASGLLHVRPVVDLHDKHDIAKFRKLADGVSALTLQFKGSLAAEHGVGMARTEYMAQHLGLEILTGMREVKSIFDPKGLMNPGKIFPDSPYRIDKNLRQGAGSKKRDAELFFEPRLAYAAKDHSFIDNLEQCNGNGACRKLAPTMCPTFQAQPDDIMSTRGRANTIRAAVEGRLGADPLNSPELTLALKYCLSCKACKSECPSNVDMALLKTDLLYARNKANGTPIGARMVSRVDLLGAWASRMPALANKMMRDPRILSLLEKTAGFTRERPLPPYARQRFDSWFHRRGNGKQGSRGRVILWDDCFVRYNEPHIGQAAVQVLEAAGYEVELLKGRACCGRPAFSMGCLDQAAAFGKQNLKLLRERTEPIIFLEPSCYSMFKSDYAELKLDGAQDVAPRAWLFEGFIDKLLREDATALLFQPVEWTTAIHGHCHAKALSDAGLMPRLAQQIPGNSVRYLNTGCCGMAGAYGSMAATYEMSLKVADPLVSMINALPDQGILVASGTSCRHQITHLTQAEPLHMAELLAQALEAPVR